MKEIKSIKIGKGKIIVSKIDTKFCIQALVVIMLVHMIFFIIYFIFSNLDLIIKFINSHNDTITIIAGIVLFIVGLRIIIKNTC